VKPFSLGELAAGCGRWPARQDDAAGDRGGTLQLDTGAREARVNGSPSN
jgi:hypothetical protein